MGEFIFIQSEDRADTGDIWRRLHKALVWVWTTFTQISDSSSGLWSLNGKGRSGEKRESWARLEHFGGHQKRAGPSLGGLLTAFPMPSCVHVFPFSNTLSCSPQIKRTFQHPHGRGKPVWLCLCCVNCLIKGDQSFTCHPPPPSSKALDDLSRLLHRDAGKPYVTICTRAPCTLVPGSGGRAPFRTVTDSRPIRKLLFCPWKLCWALPRLWAFLVAQLVKNLPAMWETWVRSLGWEDHLEKGKPDYLFQHSGLENFMDFIVNGVAKSRTWLSDFHFTSQNSIKCMLGKSMLVHGPVVRTLCPHCQGPGFNPWSGN